MLFRSKKGWGMTKEILKDEIRKLENKIVDCSIALGHIKPGTRGAHDKAAQMELNKFKRADLVLKLNKLK